MASRFYLLLLFSAAIAACTPYFPELEQEEQGKLYRVFDFSTDKFTFGTDWVSCEIQDFNIDPNARIDSIIFEAGLRSQLLEEHCQARLYNYDEDRPVTGTLLESRFHYVIHTLSTRDIQRSFPKGEARVGAQFRSTRENHFAGLTTLRVIVFYSRD